MSARLRRHLLEGIDPASLVAFRVLFGLVAAIGAARFLIYGWVGRFYEEPSFFFHYLGFEWVRPLPNPWMHVAFGALVVLGLLIAAGIFYRASVVTFFVLFTYVELIDVSGYLNHYYLVSVLALWMCVLPLGSSNLKNSAPRWVLYALRLQVGAVYFYAAIAKATGDWLVHAQPLQIWLSARTDVPFVGHAIEYFGLNTFALLAAWAGFLHDLLIVPALLWRRTRPFAFAALMLFHLATHLLFNIGMFPLIMTCAATVFLAPSWPRRFLRGRKPAAPQTSKAPPVAVVAFVALLALVQLFAPLRAFAYGGNVLWHEQGMRFSWRVMCREKNGSVSFRVRSAEGRETIVAPRRYLTEFQEREMSSQPDLILQLAHRIGADNPGAEIYVDALVSLNGRRATRLIDPEVDLVGVQDGQALATWILPAPTAPPH
ncbi:MAG: vitamin K-dependent gamma-carboxylase [Polyangiales bacterium]|jgi:vitamin K-dependent gamma-carboxylase